ncbi:hypothetical protein CL97_gp169 [Cronobacter phage CR9]|uniref:Uncharacterized protein n=1 Tax=Cronobacter phage CR9 TaxID=1162290 RepID=M1EZE6_9CAUD|nr:hypothetical protein CL97_gp169 [Cronobacter phage CR9]AFH21053.1 hypothetical protein CR9_169 [Cronobacter phage CR9]
MIIENALGKTDFLRSLEIGKPQTWYCKKKAHDEMKDFTATLARVKISITQKKALLVIEGQIPQSVVIVERTA